MKYISTPLVFLDQGARIQRDIEERQNMLDNLIELVVFTPRGQFDADPDFGFEYWNHEFSNIHYREFNTSQTGHITNGLYNEVTKKECEESIKQSLASYEPMLKDVIVNIGLAQADGKQTLRRRVHSKYEITVNVEGRLDDGLGTLCPYSKSVVFFVEPTVKRYR